MDLILAVVFTPKSKYEAELISSINKYSNVFPHGALGAILLEWLDNVREVGNELP